MCACSLRYHTCSLRYHTHTPPHTKQIKPKLHLIILFASEDLCDAREQNRETNSDSLSFFGAEQRIHPSSPNWYKQSPSRIQEQSSSLRMLISTDNKLCTTRHATETGTSNQVCRRKKQVGEKEGFLFKTPQHQQL